MSAATLRHKTVRSGQDALEDRLDELASLLAAGILRQRLRQMAGIGEPHKYLENGLDAGARKSVHASRT